MANSILNDVKKLLGLSEDYTAFDPDITLYINGVFSTLQDLGLGPEDGFMITDSSATWDQFLGDDKRVNNVKNYMVLRVRMLFDPPATSYALTAIQDQIKELEWRINVKRESTTYPLISTGDTVTVDGGGASNDPYEGIIWDGGGA